MCMFAHKLTCYVCDVQFKNWNKHILINSSQWLDQISKEDCFITLKTYQYHVADILDWNPGASHGAIGCSFGSNADTDKYVVKYS